MIKPIYLFYRMIRFILNSVETTNKFKSKKSQKVSQKKSQWQKIQLKIFIQILTIVCNLDKD